MKFFFFKRSTPEEASGVESVGWRLSDENKEKLEATDVDFAFEQAEKQLEGTVNEADVLLTRTSILLTVILGFIASIIGFIITEIESEKINYPILLTAILSVIYLAWLTFNLLKNFKGHKYKTIGSEPKLLLDEYYIIKYTDNEKRKVKVKLSEIQSYQTRIEDNKKTNKDRWDIFNYSLKKMVYFPFLLVSSYLALKLIFILF